MNIVVDRERLIAEIEELALISDAQAPAVTRVVFSPTDMRARAWFIARCEKAGLQVRRDATGNTFARWPGSDPSTAAIGTSSHIDAIPNAGKSDRMGAGLGGLEAIPTLHQNGFRPKRAID